MVDVNQQLQSGPSKDNGSSFHSIDNFASSNYRLSTNSNSNSKEGRSYANSEPGSAWTTKKFNEDYERAFMQLQDQKWSMGAFSFELLWLSC